MILYSKNKILSFLLFMLLLAPIAGAASSAGDVKEADIFKVSEKSTSEDDLFTELSTQMDLYNENFDSVPSLIKRLVGSEEIAGKIELENGEMLYVTLLMKGGKVGDFYSYETPNDPDSKFGPSITVESDEETIREILDSDDTLKQAVEKMNDDSLNVEVEGVFRKTVLWSIKQMY